MVDTLTQHKTQVLLCLVLINLLTHEGMEVGCKVLLIAMSCVRAGTVRRLTYLVIYTGSVVSASPMKDA